MPKKQGYFSFMHFQLHFTKPLASCSVPLIKYFKSLEKAASKVMSLIFQYCIVKLYFFTC